MPRLEGTFWCHVCQRSVDSAEFVLSDVFNPYIGEMCTCGGPMNFALDPHAQEKHVEVLIQNAGSTI